MNSFLESVGVHYSKYALSGKLLKEFIDNNDIINFEMIEYIANMIDADDDLLRNYFVCTNENTKEGFFAIYPCDFSCVFMKMQTKIEQLEGELEDVREVAN